MPTNAHVLTLSIYYVMRTAGRVIFGVVQIAEEIGNDPQMHDNQILVPLAEPTASATHTVNSPVQVAGVQKVTPGRAPKLEEHSADVLRDWASPRRRSTVFVRLARFRNLRPASDFPCSMQSLPEWIMRWLLGFPKVLAQPRLEVRHDSLVGTFDYNGVRVATAAMTYKYHALEGSRCGRRNDGIVRVSS